MKTDDQDSSLSEVTCAIGVGNTFSCVGAQGQSVFQTCGVLGSDYANDVVLADGLAEGCVAFSMQAICPTTVVVTSTAP